MDHVFVGIRARLDLLHSRVRQEHQSHALGLAQMLASLTEPRVALQQDQIAFAVSTCSFAQVADVLFHADVLRKQAIQCRRRINHQRLAVMFIRRQPAQLIHDLIERGLADSIAVPLGRVQLRHECRRVLPFLEDRFRVLGLDKNGFGEQTPECGLTATRHTDNRNDRRLRFRFGVHHRQGIYLLCLSWNCTLHCAGCRCQSIYLVVRSVFPVRPRHVRMPLRSRLWLR